MKNILITGANSYIGTSFENYMKEYSGYRIDTMDMQDPDWKKHDFSQYDTVFHVAGIAHRKETKDNAYLYHEVNCVLAQQTAEIAKKAGVRHFVFMSSMSVYGLTYSSDYISLNTRTNPINSYGKSKLEAEYRLLEIESNDFIISILRPPMVYGEGSPGNLSKLFRMVRKLHMFPTVKNQRSSITIMRLCECIKTVIDLCQKGIILPQNDSYMCTCEIVKEQMKKENVKVIYIPLFNPIIKFLIGKNKLITKCFGDLRYEK